MTSEPLPLFPLEDLGADPSAREPEAQSLRRKAPLPMSPDELGPRSAAARAAAEEPAERQEAVDATGPLTRLLLTPTEVAAVLGIGRTKLYELMGDGIVPSVTIGASRRIVASDLPDVVERLRRRHSPVAANGPRAAD